ncbi:MAG: Ribonuclease [Actinomycetota bacterium]|nr:Ribonuclease [Actinomycetota bacterium]
MRNRIRRRLRAISREAAPLLSPGAYLVGVNAKATSLSYQELRSAVFEALGTLGAPSAVSSSPTASTA